MRLKISNLFRSIKKHILSSSLLSLFRLLLLFGLFTFASFSHPLNGSFSYLLILRSVKIFSFLFWIILGSSDYHTNGKKKPLTQHLINFNDWSNTLLLIKAKEDKKLNLAATIMSIKVDLASLVFVVFLEVPSFVSAEDASKQPQKNWGWSSPSSTP